MSFRAVLNLLFLFLLASQIYWLAVAYEFARRRIASRAVRVLVLISMAALLLVPFFIELGWPFRSLRLGQPAGAHHVGARDALLVTPFLWWLPSSLAAFLVVCVLWIVRAVVWAARRAARARPFSPARRQLLEHAAAGVVAVPFVAGAYGVLYGRLNLDITRPRVPLRRLPRAFEGFRIAQLSDIHIGPYMSEDQIRKYVEIANELKPDLAVLTGDFITWDRETQQPVVAALAGLKAPFGVFACLGNHEAWSGVNDSITLLFEQAGVRMLRQARAGIARGSDALNLIGVDAELGRHMPRSLRGVENLMRPDSVNILLSHYPYNFPDAAELGIDLTLSGHTHGGQVALDFISRNAAPSRMISPFVAGWYRESGALLYVNRGIGTIGVPMRIGAPPELTIFELVRQG